MVSMKFAYHQVSRSGVVVSMPDYDVRGPRFESHLGRLCLSRVAAMYNLGHGLCTSTDGKISISLWAE